jgi:hypothetical protein
LVGLIQPGRQALVEARQQVPVDVHSRDDRGVAEANLDLLGVGSLGDQEALASVSQIVESKWSQSGLLHCRQSVALSEVVPPEKLTFHSGEHEVAGWCLGQMVPKLIDKERRDRQLAAAVDGLGRLDAAGRRSPDLLERADDLDRRMQKVQTGALEAHEFAPATPEIGGRQHERAEGRLDRVG